jgi:hypothetical protein
MSEADRHWSGCVPGEPDENCLEAISAVAAVLERGASQWDNLVGIARYLVAREKRTKLLSKSRFSTDWRF